MEKIYVKIFLSPMNRQNFNLSVALWMSHDVYWKKNPMVQYRQVKYTVIYFWKLQCVLVYN